MHGLRQERRRPEYFHFIGAISLVTAMVGCAPVPVAPTPPPQAAKSWHNVGATSNLNTDIGQCQVQGYGTPGLDPTQSMMVFLGCMKARGWSFY